MAQIQYFIFLQQNHYFVNENSFLEGKYRKMRMTTCAVAKVTTHIRLHCVGIARARAKLKIFDRIVQIFAPAIFLEKGVKFLSSTGCESILNDFISLQVLKIQEFKK